MSRTTVRLAVVSALAAQSALVAGAARAAGSELEEITVTATRVATDVQDIPLAITAFSATGLEEKNITNIEDLTDVPPLLSSTTI